MIIDIFHKIRTKVKSILTPTKYVAPYVPKHVWEKQYRSGEWDHLEKEEEKEHYNTIVKFLLDKGFKGDVLDIGSGSGLLYQYLKQEDNSGSIDYYGIDISENAVHKAREVYDVDCFSACNYETESIDRRFDCVIYNETLYYFNNTDKTLRKTIAENLEEGGRLIVSMVAYGKHDKIWEYIDSEFKVLRAEEVTNDKGVKWIVKIIEPV